MESPMDSFKRVKKFLTHGLWRTNVRALSMSRRLSYRALRLLMVLVQDMSSGHLNLRAMSLVYTTLLSLVPLLAVSFSVLKAFGVHNQIEPLLMNLVAPLGEQGRELVDNVLGFVENMKVGVLGALGLGLLLYTVVSLIQKVESAFNHVWHTESSRPLSRRFSDYLSVIMVGPVLIFSAIGITASMMGTELVQTLISIEPFGTLLMVLTWLLPYLLVLAAFSFLYMFIPNTKVKPVSALVGALVGGTLWQLSGLAFAEFASSSTRYAAVYAGFAIMIMSMIWLYLSWLILLLGAQVSYYYQNPEQIRPNSQRAPIDGRLREQLGLLIMYRVAERFVKDGGPMSVEALSLQLHIPRGRIIEILRMLENRGLLVETNDEPPEFILAHDPASHTVASLLASIRCAENDHNLLVERLHSVAAVDTLITRLDEGLREELAGMTLRDLVTGSLLVDDSSGFPHRDALPQKD